MTTVTDRTMQKTSRQTPPTLEAVARGLACFIGAFTLLNQLGGLLAPHFDANLWWIDVRRLPLWLADPLLFGVGALLIAFTLRPAMGRLRRWMTLIGLLALLVITACNAAVVLTLHARGVIRLGFPLPFSSLIGLAVLVVLGAVYRPAASRRGAVPWLVGTVLLCGVAFPIAQLYCFGMTDYRQQADVIVVFGAKAYRDGTPSTALEDRLRTGCSLYHEGYAPYLLFSGGPSGGDMHETESMRRYARAHGVPADAILLDRGGLDTQSTVRDTVPVFRQHGFTRVIAVSHFFHLARIKMTYQRAGWDVITVPAADPKLPVTQLPHLVLRETAAFWAYYLRPLVGR